MARRRRFRGIVLGVDLARTLAVAAGDRVVYMGQHNGATEVSSRLFRVKGILRTGAASSTGSARSGTSAWSRRRSAPPTLRTASPCTSPIRSRRTTPLPSFARVRVEERPRRAHLAGGAARAVRADSAHKSSGDVMLMILGVIVAMGVLNTMLMSVLERTREFGVMLAIGLTPWAVSRRILLEGAAIGVIPARSSVSGSASSGTGRSCSTASTTRSSSGPTRWRAAA